VNLDEHGCPPSSDYCSARSGGLRFISTHGARVVEGDVPARPFPRCGIGKRIGEGTSQAVDRLADVPAHDKLTAMLTELKRAQDKLAEGSYGTCDVCGKEIGTDRLEARPWATRCVRDAAQA